MKKSVFIAILSYDGSIEIDCMVSIVRNLKWLENNGYDVHLYAEKGCCYLPMARNKAVAAFLKSGAGKLIFVDSDLTFEDSAMFKLCENSVDVIAGAYPFKVGIEGYPVTIETQSNLTPVVVDGLIKSKMVPTGLMVVTRNVFEVLENKNPSWKMNDGLIYFFDTGNLWNDGQWYGEDVAFCNRWRENGGEIWIYPNITFGHIGKRKTEGNYHEFLLSQPQPESK